MTQLAEAASPRPPWVRCGIDGDRLEIRLNGPPICLACPDRIVRSLGLLLARDPPRRYGGAVSGCHDASGAPLARVDGGREIVALGACKELAADEGGVRREVRLLHRLPPKCCHAGHMRRSHAGPALRLQAAAGGSRHDVTSRRGDLDAAIGEARDAIAGARDKAVERAHRHDLVGAARRARLHHMLAVRAAARSRFPPQRR